VNGLAADGGEDFVAGVAHVQRERDVGECGVAHGLGDGKGLVLCAVFEDVEELQELRARGGGSGARAQGGSRSHSSGVRVRRKPS
jgi:hypothetical protein